MSRRTRRSATGKAAVAAGSRNRLAAETSAPARPNKWFLAAAVLFQAGWIAFLVAMALSA